MAALTEALLDDEAVAAGVPLDRAVATHLALDRPEVGAFVVTDDLLAAVGRQVPEGRRIPVCVVSTSGAGSLASLGSRDVPGIEVVAARTTLRDLDDLAGNVARVVAAARGLGELEVRVGLPYAPGWIGAAEVVEAAGLHAAVAVPGTANGIEQLAEQLSALVELDLPFTASGPFGPRALLLAVDALVDGAGPEEAAGLLRSTDAARLGRAIAAEDPAAATRIRRRLRAVGCADVVAAAAEFDR